MAFYISHKSEVKNFLKWFINGCPNFYSFGLIFFFFFFFELILVSWEVRIWVYIKKHNLLVYLFKGVIVSVNYFYLCRYSRILCLCLWLDCLALPLAWILLSNIGKISFLFLLYKGWTHEVRVPLVCLIRYKEERYLSNVGQNNSSQKQGKARQSSQKSQSQSQRILEYLQ